MKLPLTYDAHAGLIRDANGQYVAALCPNVTDVFAPTVVKAVNNHDALVGALADSIQAWEDEEDSVQEEHAELISELNRVYNEATK